MSYSPAIAAYGQHGRIVIRGLWNNTLHVHNCEGGQIRTVTPKFNVCDITSFKDKFYVTETNTDNGRVFVYNSQLKLVNTIKVGYKAVTDRFMFVTSYSENKVYRIEMPAGGRLKALITEGLAEPWFIGSNGRQVSVSCNGEHAVHVFDTDGRLLYKYGGRGAHPGQLLKPWGVAIDHTDSLFICDKNNNRVCIVLHKANTWMILTFPD